MRYSVLSKWESIAIILKYIMSCNPANLSLDVPDGW